MRKLIYILLISLMLGSVTNCRKAYVPTGPDYTEYGWTFYDEGHFNDARRWFREAVTTDSLYVDGFNGLGWALGELDSMATSFNIFTEGLMIGDTTEYFGDLLAGRIFAAHALGIHDSAAVLGQVFIETDSLWTFSHNPHLTYEDVYVMLASSEFVLQDYPGSLSFIRRLLPSFSPDIATPAGLSELSLKIEELAELYF